MLDPALKTIVHIPNVNARESLKDKEREVNEIMHGLGEWKGVDPATGFHQIQTKGGRTLKVADLVDDSDPAKRTKVLTALKDPAQKDNDVIAKVYRFASILGWFKRGYVDVGGYITGSHPNIYSEVQNFSAILAGGPHGFDCNYLPLIRDDLTRRALAFWREGSRLRHLHAGYAFLSFFKVLESQFENTSHRVEWMKAAIEKLDGNAAKRVQELSLEYGDVGKHIYESGRCAIAHAQFSDGRGDPDVPRDRARLTNDLVVIESLARSYIMNVLQVA